MATDDRRQGTAEGCSGWFQHRRCLSFGQYLTAVTQAPNAINLLPVSNRAVEYVRNLSRVEARRCAAGFLLLRIRFKWPADFWNMFFRFWSFIGPLVGIFFRYRSSGQRLDERIVLQSYVEWLRDPEYYSKGFILH